MGNDGLWDVYNDVAMGICVDDHNITKKITNTFFHIFSFA
jgi:hypothetical protein